MPRPKRTAHGSHAPFLPSLSSGGDQSLNSIRCCLLAGNGHAVLHRRREPVTLHGIHCRTIEDAAGLGVQDLDVTGLAIGIHRERHQHPAFLARTHGRRRDSVREPALTSTAPCGSPPEVQKRRIRVRTAASRRRAAVRLCRRRLPCSAGLLGLLLFSQRLLLFGAACPQPLFRRGLLRRQLVCLLLIERRCCCLSSILR